MRDGGWVGDEGWQGMVGGVMRDGKGWWVGDEGLVFFQIFFRFLFLFLFFSFSGMGNGRWADCFSMGVLLLLLRPMFFWEGVDCGDRWRGVDGMSMRMSMGWDEDEDEHGRGWGRAWDGMGMGG